MIVKHVSEALRRQDWAAVGIEFLLVVLGVLLAFQINEWAAEREARSERAAAVERLLDEAEETVAYFRAGVSAQAQLMADLDFALERVSSGRWQASDEPRMTIGLLRVINAASPAPPSSIYDDLVASGTFGQIGDIPLRASIADYRATLRFHERYVDYMRPRIPEFEQYDAFRYTFDPKGRRRVRLAVDFAALRRDSGLQEELALVAGAHSILLNTRQRTMADAAAMCVELGRVADRTCNLHRPEPNFN